MPLRERAGSSPIRKPKAKEGMELPVTSPSRRSAEGRLRSGSVEAVESLKQRARKGTLTGSDMSSENELDPEVFKRRHVNPRKAGKAATAGFGPSGEGESLHLKNQPTTIDEDSAEYSDRTSLSSEFGATADSESILNHIGDPKFSPFDPVQPKIAESPKKPRAQSLELQALPPRRPISTIQPKSLLSQSLRGGPSEPKNPLESFAMFSGKGDLDPLNIRMYAPFSDNPSKPFEIPLLRVILSPKSWTKVPVTVADAIGFSLWRYCEEKLQPPIEASKLSVNRWTLRMVEDGDVDYDFPALSRNKPIGDFTSNNNRAARGRSKEKSYDEFALVEATDAQTKENQTLTPKYDQLTPTVKDNSIDKPQIKPQDHKHASLDPVTASSASTEKPIYIRNDTPAGPSSQPKQRKIPIKTLRIHYTNLEAVTETTIMQIPYETNLAEVFEAACARWSLDKIGHVLRVSGKHVVVPLDQPVKVIGDIIDLVLVERRFFKEGYFGSAGSPRSSSPNAPLLLTSNTSPQKGKRGGAQPLRPYQEHWGTGVAGQYKRYNVTRKQPMSFAPSHQRVLLIDEEYLHILPVETSKTFFESSAKSVQIPFSMIVGCKISRRHPKSFHVSHIHLYTPIFILSSPHFRRAFRSPIYPHRDSQVHISPPHCFFHNFSHRTTQNHHIN